MSQVPRVGSRVVGPQTGYQVLDQEIIASQPTSVNIAAAQNSTAFTAFQCFFRGSLRGVLISFGSSDNTINVPNCEIRRSVAVLPASPTEAQVVGQGGVDSVFANPGALNPIFNSGPIDFSNAFQQGDLPIFPGDVLFAKFFRAVAAANPTNCGATWRFGRNPGRMF